MDFPSINPAMDYGTSITKAARPIILRKNPKPEGISVGPPVSRDAHPYASCSRLFQPSSHRTFAATHQARANTAAPGAGREKCHDMDRPAAPTTARIIRI